MFLSTIWAGRHQSNYYTSLVDGPYISYVIQGSYFPMSGYTKLATFMVEKHHPILKKHQYLAVRDLLYLQAELCELEFKYDSIAKNDALEEDERQYYDRDWLHMETSQQRGFGGEQWAIALAIRQKLREYCESISSPCFLLP
jgi:hypothetical protein